MNVFRHALADLFLAAHMSVWAGAGFFTVEVLKWRGLVTY